MAKTVVVPFIHITQPHNVEIYLADLTTSMSLRFELENIALEILLKQL